MSEYTYINNNGIKYRYSAAVDSLYKEKTEQALDKLYNLSNKNTPFFSNLDINICSSWKDFEESKDFSSFWSGGAIEPVTNKGKYSLFVSTGAKSPYRKNRKLSNAENTLMHEIGHLFNFYFSNPDKVLGEKIIKIMTEEQESYLEQFNVLYSEYNKNNELSDSDEFKNAWKHDVENNSFKRKASSIFRYFSPTFNHHTRFDAGHKIKLSDGVSEEEVNSADSARSEVFAECFAIVMGTSRGGRHGKELKEYILKKYPKCYELVKKYINKYLGIDVNDEQNQNFDLEA